MSPKAELFKIIKASFRENIKPGLVLQAAGLAIVLMYYFFPWFTGKLGIIGQWKAEGGYLYSGVSTALFGGVFPFVLLYVKDRKQVRGRAASLLVFYILFWFWKGMEVDLMYRVQAWLYGDTNHWLVILKKTATDQLVYCPLWAVPTMMLFYLWKDAGFKFEETRARLRRDSFGQRYLRVLFSNLIVWVPAVAIIYQLPLVLQIPLFNLVLAFWTLILNSVSER